MQADSLLSEPPGETLSTFKRDVYIYLAFNRYTPCLRFSAHNILGLNENKNSETFEHFFFFFYFRDTFEHLEYPGGSDDKESACNEET